MLITKTILWEKKNKPFSGGINLLDTLIMAWLETALTPKLRFENILCI